jgi:hypothetical protein
VGPVTRVIIDRLSLVGDASGWVFGNIQVAF